MELVLRIKGIIGNLKLFAILGVIVSILLLQAAATRLFTALTHAQPQPVTVSQLVNGEIESNQYVSVWGYAWYEPAYEAELGGSHLGSFFFLIDETTGHAVVVRANTRFLPERTSDWVTLRGTTFDTQNDLEELIKADMPILQEAGLETTPYIYILEETPPPSLGSTLLSVIAAGIFLLLCLSVFFFPSIVFVPQPLQTFRTPTKDYPYPKVSGQFQILKKVRPTPEFGKRSKNFTHAVADITPISNNKLLIIVHQTINAYLRGVRADKLESEWGVLLDCDNVTRIEPGKLYALKILWAMRFHYIGPKGLPQTLIVGFKEPWGQTAFINHLREMGFQILEQPCIDNSSKTDILEPSSSNPNRGNRDD